MKITPLYPNKNNALATAQVLAEPSQDDPEWFDLEASLQFVNGNGAVEYDFSLFIHKGEEADTEAIRIRAELAALQAMQNHLNEFVEAYSKAAAEALEFVG